MTIEEEYEQSLAIELSNMKKPNRECTNSFRSFLLRKGYSKDKIDQLWNKRMGRLCREAQAEPMPPLEIPNDSKR